MTTQQAVVYAAALICVSCGSGERREGTRSTSDPTKSASATLPVTSTPAITVAVDPLNATLWVGGQQAFTGTVQNAYPNTAVTWSLTRGGAACLPTCGTLVGIGPDMVTYSAPEDPPVSDLTVTITATSVADTTKSGSATITVLAIAVMVWPVSANVPIGGSEQFIANVIGDGGDGHGVTWTLLQAGAPCSPGCGSLVGAITAPGTGRSSATYLPAGSLPTNSAVTVTATSVRDPSKSGSAAVTIVPNPPPALTTLSPSSIILGGPAFTLTVNGWDFVPGSVVQLNGSDRLTKFVSSCQVTAQISASDIAATGTVAITVFNPAPGGGGSNSLKFTIERLGCGFAYVANNDSGDVSMFSINATTGALIPIAPVTTAAGTFPSSVAVDPSGRFAYVANSGSNDVSMYTINATSGALQSVGTIAAGAGSTSVAADPSGRFAYVANIFGGLPFAPGDPLGFGGTVSMYVINASTGALTPVAPGTIGSCSPPAPVPGCGFSGTHPSSVAVDSSGKFAYVANQGLEYLCSDSDWGCPFVQGDVSIYAVNAITGALMPLGTMDAGTHPISVALDRFGKFAYVANYGSNDVSTYTINGTTGALTLTGTIATGVTPLSVATDPSGKFAYVANYGSNDVSMYTINATSGALTSLGTIAAGTAPLSVATDPSGKFAYVANYGSNDVSMYTIDPSTGALTAAGTVTAGTGPSSVATTGICQ